MPRKTLRERRETENRFKKIKKNLIGVESPDYLMNEILNVLDETTSSYEISPGTYCTFIYAAKTPNEIYDKYPLVAVTNVFDWGFRGINFHWGRYRNYTHEEFLSDVFIVRNNEINDLRSIPYQKYIYKS